MGSGHRRLIVAQVFLPDVPIFGFEGSSPTSEPGGSTSPTIEQSLASLDLNPPTSPHDKRQQSISIVEDMTAKSSRSSANPSGRSSPALPPSNGLEMTPTPAMYGASPTSSFSSSGSRPPTLPRSKSSSAVNRLPPQLPPPMTAMPAVQEPSGQRGSHFRERTSVPIDAPPAKAKPAISMTPMLGGQNDKKAQRPPLPPPPSFSRSKTHRRRSSSVNRSSSLNRYEQGSSLVPPFHFETNPHTNGGLVNAVKSDRASKQEVLWVGTPGCDTDYFDKKTKREVERRFAHERDSIVAFVPDDVLEASYSGYCKQILWHTMHYSLNDMAIAKSVFQNVATEDLWWQSYVATNTAIADRIVDAYRAGDIVLINGYHLLLVPGLVRDKLPRASIGFFLHIAFPSSELFRCLAQRTELLQGMLGADLIAFQTFQHSRHFRITVSRVLGNETGPQGVKVDRGHVNIEVIPIGIDVKALRAKAQTPDIHDRYKSMQKQYDGLKIIVGRDKLDLIKGVREKLLGFERFLELFPDWVGRVVLVQIATVAAGAAEVQGRLGEVLTRINSRYATLTYSPVVFLHQDVPFEQYLALLKAADAFIATSLREGMNLTSHEYVTLQEGHFGPLILSEFTGSYTAASFRSCLPVNPFDTLSVANAIYKALTMSNEEAEDRWHHLNHDVCHQTAQHWISSFVSRTEQASLEAHRPTITASSPRQIINVLEPGYKAADSRLLLIDLPGGPFPDSAKGRAVPDEVIELINGFTSTAAVYVMSSYGDVYLEPLMKKLPGVGCIAENGCDVRLAGSIEWHDRTQGMDLSWRPTVHEILAYYTERTPGSFVEDRGTAIAWHFCAEDVAVDSDDYRWPRRQATETQNHILDSLGEKASLQIVNGARAFTVMPRKVSRSAAASFILAEHGADAFDYVIAISGDERLHGFLHRLEHDTAAAEQMTFETVGVGERHRESKRCVKDSMGALEVLRGLAAL